MIDIILISPNLQIAESAIEAKKIYGLDLTIKCGLMEEAVGIAREIINSDNNIKIFISRGGTALKLSEIEEINLVEIKITVEDIFDAINCASLSTSILESELFGYAEGTFTGAKKTGKPGVFEMAQDGTL